METFDAIIVGAGPAGSTCAARLKAAGLRVKLYDKKVFPRVKPCAGWVTPQVIQSLQIDLAEYQRENTLQPITGFRTGIIGRRVIETNYDHPVSYGILRVEFDHYLLQRSGVPCEFQAVKLIKRDNDVWIVNGCCSAPLIIGAGGHFCPVARHVQQNPLNHGSPTAEAGQSNAALPVVVYAQEIEFEISSRQAAEGQVHPEKPELYFCKDMQGYGWCFRKGDFLNIGLGRLQKSELSAHVNRFCDFLCAQQKLVNPLPSHFLGHAYQLYAQRQPKLFDDGVVLIGDAAGLAYPQSGEGIRPAIESALIASDVIARAAGNYGSVSLASYGNRLTERFGPPQPYQAARWLPAAWLQAIATRLMATQWFAKSVVVDNWFLHRQQGALKI